MDQYEMFGCLEKRLAKKDVILCEPPDQLWLQCMSCGQKWSPLILAGGRLPPYYWCCPAGCNVSGQSSKTANKKDNSKQEKINEHAKTRTQ